jgi:ureidoglycolate lyase
MGKGATMNPNALIAQPLLAKTFAPFGDVIEAAEPYRTINYGHTLRFDSGATLDLDAKNGRPGVSIFRAAPLPAPISIEVMERHPLSSQAFYPLSPNPYLVVVAPKGTFDPSKICAFLAAPEQGVNYHPGVWHHYLLALHTISDFLVIDRLGEGENCDEVKLENGPSVHLEPSL